MKKRKIAIVAFALPLLMLLALGIVICPFQKSKKPTQTYLAFYQAFKNDDFKAFKNLEIEDIHKCKRYVPSFYFVNKVEDSIITRTHFGIVDGSISIKPYQNYEDTTIYRQFLHLNIDYINYLNTDRIFFRTQCKSSLIKFLKPPTQEQIPVYEGLQRLDSLWFVF